LAERSVGVTNAETERGRLRPRVYGVKRDSVPLAGAGAEPQCCLLSGARHRNAETGAHHSLQIPRTCRPVQPKTSRTVADRFSRNSIPRKSDTT